MTTYQSSSSAASMTNKAPPSGVKKHREVHVQYWTRKSS